MRLRRFSQLGWLGCQDLAGFVMGSEVERVELGVPPYEYWDEVGEVTPGLIQMAMDSVKGLPIQEFALTYPGKWADSPALKMEMCGRCEQMKPKEWFDSWQPHEVCSDCYWEQES